MMGMIPMNEALPYFVGAVIWTGILFGATVFIWKRGIVKYSAFGG
jgi:ABC-type uncharacterized transport system permease subunit